MLTPKKEPRKHFLRRWALLETKRGCEQIGGNPGFHRDVHDICPLLGYYTAWNAISVPTFRDNMRVIPSKVKKFKNNIFLTFKARNVRLSQDVGMEFFSCYFLVVNGFCYGWGGLSYFVGA